MTLYLIIGKSGIGYMGQLKTEKDEEADLDRIIEKGWTKTIKLSNCAVYPGNIHPDGMIGRYESFLKENKIHKEYKIHVNGIESYFKIFED